MNQRGIMLEQMQDQSHMEVDERCLDNRQRPEVISC